MDLSGGDFDHGWECPWCGVLADKPSNLRVICPSRMCVCGALALAAPPWDSDEIIDDAINVFGIANGYLTEFDSDRLAGLRAVGVEVAEDHLSLQSQRNSEMLILWFRKLAPAT